ncbi:MAG: AbrB/MazE/SpoVT family DNA-binding domain-containing protein [Candidatus Bathyarchaeota archaeon]|nr:AbrB/MazE/SpoVT family DNA-binding domain-containing protein [Candidatus Bathyarchaeota archaeon]
MQKLSQVKVKRKGQVTIPKEMRTKLDIEEGTTLNITTEDNKIILKPAPRLEAGEPVGEEEQKKLLQELEALRRRWR